MPLQGTVIKTLMLSDALHPLSEVLVTTYCVVTVGDATGEVHSVQLNPSGGCHR